MKRVHGITMVALAAALVAAGCATGRNVQARSASGSATSNAVRVDVQNDNIDDMDIYVMGGGQVWRLGHVTGMGSANLTIPSGIVASATQLRLLADPLASLSAYLSDPVTVTSGDVIQLTIGSSLPLSSVSVY